MHLPDFREPVSAWTHFVALLFWLPGIVILWRRSRGEAGKRLSLCVYGLCLVACYTASTLYHGVRLPSDRLAWYARLDSIGIFALIAGTYTPLVWNLMRGRWRVWTLTAVWGTALTAIAMLASGGRLPTVLATVIYLVMGWGVVVCYAQMARVVTHRALSLVVLGGVLYSLGAVLNLLKKPILWPGSFGTHDLFHLFVIAGSLAHYWFILAVVLPFRGHPGPLPGPIGSTPASIRSSRN